ncbi:MAG: hypothetical protein V1848_01105 [Candidatus Magasanikbacteria bacterium]
MFEIILEKILDFFTQDPSTVILEAYGIGGYLFFFFVLLRFALLKLAEYKSMKLSATWNWVYLAIDVPQLNIQTPKAVEQIFATIHSAMEAKEIGSVYRHGYTANSFSFEVVSIEGYIQFIVRTRDEFRDLIEASVYAQYPDAEITEIEDYTSSVPLAFPNETHNLWGAEFGLVEHHAFPLRTYDEFVHTISKDTQLKDPMSAFLESFSRIGAGEQMWFQVVVQPVSDSSWKKESIEKIQSVFAGEAPKKKSSILADVSEHPKLIVSGALDQILNRTAAEPGKPEKPVEKRQQITPGQAKLVENMEEKIRKMGYKTKIRAMYIGKKEVFHPNRGVNALIGAISQFNIPSSNSLIPTFSTGASYFFAEKNKNKKRNMMLKAYAGRSVGKYLPAYVLNIEELATIWHFPMSYVKTPMVQKTESKRAEPPSSLPMMDVDDEMEIVKKKEEAEQRRKKYMTDAGLVDDDEQSFG